MQAVEEVAVDVVVRDGIRPDELVGFQHGDAGSDGEAAVAGENVGVSRGVGSTDPAILVDGGDGGIVRMVEGEMGDVAPGAIALVGEDAELGVLCPAFENEPFLGKLDAGGVGHVFPVVGRTGGDPVVEGPVVGAVDGEDLAAGVGHLAEGLEQKQAALRHGRVDAATGDVVDDAVVVARRIVAEEGEHETVLALGRAVTGAGIATGAEQDRHDILSKAGDALGEDRGREQERERRVDRIMVFKAERVNESEKIVRSFPTKPGLVSDPTGSGRKAGRGGFHFRAWDRCGDCLSRCAAGSPARRLGR